MEIINYCSHEGRLREGSSGCHCLVSEIALVDVDVTKQQETVRAVAGQQKLDVERRELSESSFMEVLRLDLCLCLGEKFVVVLPENRLGRDDSFEGCRWRWGVSSRANSWSRSKSALNW